MGILYAHVKCMYVLYMRYGFIRPNNASLGKRGISMQGLRTNPASMFFPVPAICHSMLKFAPQDVIKCMRRDAHEARRRSKDVATRVYFGMRSRPVSDFTVCWDSN